MHAGVTVEVRQAALSFGRTQVLRDIDVTVGAGEFFALLGPSGCGKSTLLRLIAGFNRAQSGRVLIDGEDITDMPPWERNVGMVFQSYALWPHLTVGQNVAFGLEERRQPREEVQRRVKTALSMVGLSELASRRPGQLSGGQQQRVALARTIAVEPRVLLLDEPLSNLDAKLRTHMRRELVALQRKLGITTIFVTHDQEEAMTTADRIAVMDQGVIQQVGSPLDLFDRPLSRFVAEFVGSINLITGTLRHEGNDFTVFHSQALGSLRLPQAAQAEGGVAIAFRPHSVTICLRDANKGDSSGRNLWLAGTVAENEFLGEFIRYHVRVGEVSIIADQAHFSGGRLFERGSPVSLGLDTEQLHYLRG